MFGLIAGCKGDKGNPLSPQDEAQRYLPLANGNQWVYDHTSNYSGTDTTVPLTVKLDSPYTQNGIQWYGVNEFCDDDFRMANPLPLFYAAWARDGNKVLTIEERGPVLYNPEVVLDFPLYVGKQWIIKSLDTTYITLVGSERVIEKVARKVNNVESVTVRAGNFAYCSHLHDSKLSVYIESFESRVLVDSTTVETDEWYAMNVGMVKQSIVTTHTGTSITPTTTRLKNELRQYSVKLSD